MVTNARPRPVPLPHGGTAFFAINRYRCDLGGVEVVPTLAVPVRGRGKFASMEFDRGWEFRGPGDPGSIVHVSPFAPTIAATLAQM
jgi:hypothetical protein